MRKKLLIISVNLVLVLTLGGLLLKLLFQAKPQMQDFADMEYALQNKTYRLLIADTLQKQMKGLMNFRKLDGFDGMIFLFPNKDYRAFWNQNTYMDLQIYWLNDDKVVGTEVLPSIGQTKTVKTIYSPEPVNKVIELVITH